ncbi:MAG: succinylglutamate desuccinylase/aspartoacylase family protein [Cyclobacteriaceae bacterium]
MERLLGKIEGSEKGPLVVCVAGLHGNEQIGIHAFRNVFSAIQKHSIKIKGKLVGFCGNISAITTNRRYIDYDMNRVWFDHILEDISKGQSPIGAESKQVEELYHAIEAELVGGDYTCLIFADLHATSSVNGNFVVIPEDEADHPVIKSLKLPVVLEIDKYLEGTLLAYYHKKGFISFAFEGGTIGTEHVYQLHTSGLWEILDKAGMISEHDHEVEDHYANLLASVGAGLPRSVAILYHHKVKPTDQFRMLPGYKNFQPIHKGQHLAIDYAGNILAPFDGMIFMPLYQSEGEDGFFIVEEVKANISV